MITCRCGVLVGALLVVQPCRADKIVDHTDLAGVPSSPQWIMDEVGQQRWLFTHASVGVNIVDGLAALHADQPSFYQLTTSPLAYDSTNLTVPAAGAATPGTVYECDRGNPGASTKFQILDHSVRLSGWHDSAVSIVMDKLCYVDQDASATEYLNVLTGLESAYPGTVFVYATMPLTTAGDSGNVQRNAYNAAVRAFCQSHDKFLFDIADLEAWDPAGIRQTFSLNSVSYDLLYSGYTSDGGHLNAAGQLRAATCWYALAAAIVDPAPEPASALLLMPAVWLLTRRRHSTTARNA